jgi:flagellin-like protein
MSSKGVSPVVGTALLIGIAVSTALTASVFMQDTLDDVKGNFEDDVRDRNLEDKSEMSIDYGYSRSGDLFLDLRNDGSIALPLVNEEGEKVLSVYVDGRPNEDWKIPSGKETVANGGKVTINTTVAFPVQGNYTKIEIRGAHGTQSTIICYNDGSPSC